MASTLFGDDPDALSAHSGAATADIASIATGNNVLAIATAQAKPATTASASRRQSRSASGIIILNATVMLPPVLTSRILWLIVCQLAPTGPKTDSGAGSRLGAGGIFPSTSVKPYSL